MSITPTATARLARRRVVALAAGATLALWMVRTSAEHSARDRSAT